MLVFLFGRFILLPYFRNDFLFSFHLFVIVNSNLKCSDDTYKWYLMVFWFSGKDIWYSVLLVLE